MVTMATFLSEMKCRNSPKIKNYNTGKFHIYSLENKDFTHCWRIDVPNMWFFQNNLAQVLFLNDSNTAEQGLISCTFIFMYMQRYLFSVAICTSLGADEFNFLFQKYCLCVAIDENNSLVLNTYTGLIKSSLWNSKSTSVYNPCMIILNVFHFTKSKENS